MGNKIEVSIAQGLYVPNIFKDVPNFVNNVSNFVKDVPRVPKFISRWETTSNHMSLSRHSPFHVSQYLVSNLT